MCLTDGDEQSLKLTQENVDANLQPSSSRQSPQTPPACDEQQPEGAAAATPSNGDFSKPVEASHAAGEDGGGRSKHSSDRSASISVQRLRWGCEDDMHAVGCPSRDRDGGDDDGSSCRPWDVVLGSDIAALPYASAYGDLLRTIVSLVNSGKGGGNGENAAPPSARKDSDATGEVRHRGAARESAQEMERRRRVVVLLAHKRRHASEEAFFEDLTEKLGGEQSVREMGEGDIHADFRGTGIRLHLFDVEV